MEFSLPAKKNQGSGCLGCDSTKKTQSGRLQGKIKDLMIPCKENLGKGGLKRVWMKIPKVLAGKNGNRPWKILIRKDGIWVNAK